MIPISGTSSLLGLKITDATQDRQTQLIRESAQHKRAIDTFRERIADVETVDQLIDDYELYTFVMRAFDLEDQIFGKAMISKILKSNVEDDDALVNKLTDTRFRAMYDELGFGENGVGNINTILKSWQNRMVDRYVDRLFVNDQAEQNETVGIALEFRRKAPEVEGPFDILRDFDMTKFMQTVLGLPSQISALDIDRQAAILEDAYDLTKLQDPAEIERLVQRYVIIADAKNGANVQNNAVVQLMQGAVGIGQGGNFVPVTLDITQISFTNFRAYR